VTRGFRDGKTKRFPTKGGQFSDEQKAESQALALERGVGEHAFAGFKCYGIAPQVYRNRKENLDDR
jgi:hypothetical protein